jgi:DNA-binding MarR family transcriptional regulator
VEHVDDTEALTPVDATVQLSFAVQAILTRIAAEHDLSVTQLRLLGILRDRSPSMAALAAHLGLDRSSVTGLIDRAERRALVTRGRQAADARVVTVSMTAEGRELGLRIQRAVEVGIAEILEVVAPADIAALVRIATALPAFGLRGA